MSNMPTEYRSSERRRQWALDHRPGGGASVIVPTAVRPTSARVPAISM